MASRKLKSIQAIRRVRTKRSIRRKIRGTASRPRLTVFRSNRNIYVQLIDDNAGHTLVSASSLDQGESQAAPDSVGRRLAQRAADAGIEQVVFDRNGYRYHGRVKALAEGAREGGLKF